MTTRLKRAPRRSALSSPRKQPKPSFGFRCGDDGNALAPSSQRLATAILAPAQLVMVALASPALAMASTTRIVKTAYTGMNVAIIRYFGFGTGTAVGSAAARGPQSGNLFGSIIVVTGPAHGNDRHLQTSFKGYRSAVPFHVRSVLHAEREMYAQVRGSSSRNLAYTHIRPLYPHQREHRSPIHKSGVTVWNANTVLFLRRRRRSAPALCGAQM